MHPLSVKVVVAAVEKEVVVVVTVDVPNTLNKR
jgi:hypothetical protein